MNERDATDLLQRLAAGVREVPLPMDHLMAGGRTMQRRRRLRHVVAAVAVTGLALAGGAVVLQPDEGTVVLQPDEGVGQDSAPSSRGGEPAPSPTAATGSRLVGQGQVAVAVPEEWVVAEDGCARDTGVIWRLPDTEAEGRLLGPCPSSPPDDQPIASLAVGDITSPYGWMVADSSWQRQLKVNGLNIVQSSAHHGPPEFCGPSDTPGHQDCDLMFWPAWPAEEDTFIMLRVRGPTARETILSIRDSIRVLPERYTSVPFIKYGTSDADAAQILREAGLETELPHVNWPYYVIATAPDAGSVVQTGSTVRLIPGDG